MTLKEIALEILEKYHDSEISVIYEYSGAIYKDLDDLSAEIDRYTKQIEIMDMQNMGGWIPVSERLPEEPFGCIVSYHGFMLTPHGEREYDAIYPELLGYDGSEWNNSEGECVDNMIDVTAWMPLPEPYEEVQE